MELFYFYMTLEQHKGSEFTQMIFFGKNLVRGFLRKKGPKIIVKQQIHALNISDFLREIAVT